jgi:hypothetical protein
MQSKIAKSQKTNTCIWKVTDWNDKRKQGHDLKLRYSYHSHRSVSSRKTTSTFNIAWYGFFMHTVVKTIKLNATTISLQKIIMPGLKLVINHIAGKSTVKCSQMILSRVGVTWYLGHYIKIIINNVVKSHYPLK